MNISYLVITVRENSKAYVEIVWCLLQSSTADAIILTSLWSTVSGLTSLSFKQRCPAKREP